jgi:hypothetical protein
MFIKRKKRFIGMSLGKKHFNLGSDYAAQYNLVSFYSSTDFTVAKYHRLLKQCLGNFVDLNFKRWKFPNFDYAVKQYSEPENQKDYLKSKYCIDNRQMSPLCINFSALEKTVNEQIIIKDLLPAPAGEKIMMPNFLNSKKQLYSDIKSYVDIIDANLPNKDNDYNFQLFARFIPCVREKEGKKPIDEVSAQFVLAPIRELRLIVSLHGKKKDKAFLNSINNNINEIYKGIFPKDDGEDKVPYYQYELIPTKPDWIFGDKTQK